MRHIARKMAEFIIAAASFILIVRKQGRVPFRRAIRRVGVAGSLLLVGLVLQVPVAGAQASQVSAAGVGPYLGVSISWTLPNCYGTWFRAGGTQTRDANQGGWNSVTKQVSQVTAGANRITTYVHDAVATYQRNLRCTAGPPSSYTMTQIYRVPLTYVHQYITQTRFCRTPQNCSAPSTTYSMWHHGTYPR
jgi:hypothetical protein